MIIPTHRLVGKYVYVGLRKESRRKLDYGRFVWGNVKPDVLPNEFSLHVYTQVNSFAYFIINMLSIMAIWFIIDG